MTAQPRLRLATEADAAEIQALMRTSVLELFPRHYAEEQTASASIYIAHLDEQLIHDGTYFVHDVDGEIVSCGGWSKRARLFAGPADEPEADPLRLIDPATEPARVRAMFVRSSWTRRGLGREILEACERAARADGFRRFVLGATLPGEPLYRAFGFREVDRFMLMMPDGVATECVHMEREIAP